MCAGRDRCKDALLVEARAVVAPALGIAVEAMTPDLQSPSAEAMAFHYVASHLASATIPAGDGRPLTRRRLSVSHWSLLRGRIAHLGLLRVVHVVLRRGHLAAIRIVMGWGQRLHVGSVLCGMLIVVWRRICHVLGWRRIAARWSLRGWGIRMIGWTTWAVHLWRVSAGRWIGGHCEGGAVG